MADNMVCVFPGVVLPDDAVVEAFVLIGKAPALGVDAEPTTIGNSALIRSHSVIYAGCTIGDNFQCGHHVTIRESTEIGNGVSIGTGCVIEHHVVIEDRVRLHSNVFVPEFSVLRRGCWLGPNVVLTNAKYPLSPEAKQNLLGPTIMPGAKIGANATLLPGVTIGRDSLIGAGTVVVRDVPDRAVVVGNPGDPIKTLAELPYES